MDRSGHCDVGYVSLEFLGGYDVVGAEGGTHWKTTIAVRVREGDWRKYRSSSVPFVYLNTLRDRGHSHHSEVCVTPYS